MKIKYLINTNLLEYRKNREFYMINRNLLEFRKNKEFYIPIYLFGKRINQ